MDLMGSAVPQPFHFHWDLWDPVPLSSSRLDTHLSKSSPHQLLSASATFSATSSAYGFFSAPPSRIYVAQLATQGKLLLWGAKINSLIDKGQIWRLATSSLLHANIGHLMVNCYSLNSIGPTVENISGPRRFLAVYFSSAISSAVTSYWFCKAAAVGASGAIFGLVGSVAVFVMRHGGMIRDAKEDLQHIAQVIFLNMVFGLMSKGIDNWGHLGGLLGGAAMSWLLGPAWKCESMASDGRRIFSDRAPLFYLTDRKQKPR
ncbi:hypothetical protein CRYUN_Cryun18bG0130900 [Craigia yunnanensis]